MCKPHRCILKNKSVRPNYWQWTKSHPNFAIICDPVDFNQVLKAYDVGDSLLANPNPEFVSWELALLGDLQTTTMLVMLNS